MTLSHRWRRNAFVKFLGLCGGRDEPLTIDGREASSQVMIAPSSSHAVIMSNASIATVCCGPTRIALVLIAIVQLWLPGAAFAQGTNCVCRLNPVANYVTYFLYKVERRATCESPEGVGDCSAPTYAYVTGAPGLPAQACSLGECQPNAYFRPASTNGASTPVTERTTESRLWAIPAPYSADFALHTISNSNPAYFAVFPSGERPADAAVQDFTLRGVIDGRDAYVRAFRADITIHFSAEAGAESSQTIRVGSGMEFNDDNISDNVVLAAGATEPAAEDQPYCQKFVHQFAGDREPTEVVVLLVAPDKK